MPLRVTSPPFASTVIRLAGQGMPRAGGGHGDLYVTVKVVLPTKLSDKEKAGMRDMAEQRKDDDVRAHLL